MAIVYTTAWDMEASFNNDVIGNSQNRTFRLWIDEDVLSPLVTVPFGQSHVRLRFNAASDRALRINSAYFGEGYEDDEFPGNPFEYAWQAISLTLITFNGGIDTSIVIPIGESQLTDPIPFVYDGVSPLIITMDTDNVAPSGYRYSNFNIDGSEGMLPWRVNAAQKADELIIESAPGVPYEAGEDIAFENSNVIIVDRMEWGVDTEATDAVEVPKLAAYAVIKEIEPVVVPKAAGYAVVVQATPLQVPKLNAYAVLTPQAATDPFQYSYLPVVN
jgi:hypothetical protein